MNTNCVQCYNYYREIIQTLLFVGVVPNLKLFQVKMLMIHRIKVNAVLGSSLLLFEGSKRPLLTFLTLCFLSHSNCVTC